LKQYGVWFNTQAQGETSIGYVPIPMIAGWGFYVWRAALLSISDTRHFLVTIAPHHRLAQDVGPNVLGPATWPAPGVDGDIGFDGVWFAAGGELPETYYGFNHILVGPQEIRTRFELSGGSGTTGVHAVLVEGEWRTVPINDWLTLAHEFTTKIKRLVSGTEGGINVNFARGT